jgi:CRP/FNR family cyclic AMP-dependent transcriptional regulator
MIISKEFLAKIPIFQNLSAHDLEVLNGFWQELRLKKKQVLFKQGESGDAMFLIKEGSLEITVPIDAPQKKMTVSVLHEGDFVGELSLIDGQPRTATATALEDCWLLEMKRDDLIKFLMERPSVSISMMSEIGKRLRSTNELVMSLASKNVNEEIEEQLVFGDRLADKIAEFGGSWKFITAFGVLLFGWMAMNTIQLWFQPFDEYPFIFLNLMLSCLAAIQAPVIMMSQNRAQKKDRLKAELDYQVNLKSELMIQQLHVKMDEIRAEELHDLHSGVPSTLADLKTRIDALERAISSKNRVSE